MSVPGHGVRQGAATFMLRLTLMNNIKDAIGPRSVLTERTCELNCNLLQFGQPGTSRKQLFLMNTHILGINSHQYLNPTIEHAGVIEFTSVFRATIYCFISYCFICLMKTRKSKWTKLSHRCRGFRLIKLAR